MFEGLHIVEAGRRLEIMEVLLLILVTLLKDCSSAKQTALLGISRPKHISSCWLVDRFLADAGEETALFGTFSDSTSCFGDVEARETGNGLLASGTKQWLVLLA